MLQAAALRYREAYRPRLRNNINIKRTDRNSQSKQQLNTMALEIMVQS